MLRFIKGAFETALFLFLVLVLWLFSKAWLFWFRLTTKV